jgi:hypothetical protein
MASTYTPVVANAVGELTITNPSDGDALTAASANVSTQKLADFVQRLWNQMRLQSALTWIPIATADRATGTQAIGPSINGGNSLRRINALSSDGLTWLALSANSSGTTNVQVTGDFGQTWFTTSSSTTAPRAIFHDGSLWVLVGDSGLIQTTATVSTVGTTWTTRTSGTANALYDVVKGGSTWVAAGASGTILTSSDGITWTSRTGAISMSAPQLTYNSTAGLFIMVDNTGGATGYQTSPDGITWTSRSPAGITFGLNTGLSGLSLQTWTIGGTATTFCGGWNGTSWAIFSTTNGTTWTSRVSSLTGVPQTIYYNGTVMVASAGTSALPSIYTSFDGGVTWTSRTAVHAPASDVASSPTQGVAVSRYKRLLQFF